uniref:Uncharacterized protein n=1 Tax=Rhizophora mucronata TaxID=61149 RepID=A0A2P2R3U3_RHIMU
MNQIKSTAKHSDKHKPGLVFSIPYQDQLP